MPDNTLPSDAASAKRQLVADSFDLGASIYNEAPFFAIFGRQLAEAAGLARGDRVLDVATGTGAALFPASELVGDDGLVIGIDLSANMAAVAQSQIERSGIKNASARQMDAEHLDFADAHFDCVLCGFALWFIPDLQGAMREMQRVLKPSGKLAASTWPEAAVDPLSQRTNALQKSYAVPMPALGSHVLNTAGSLTRVLQEAGWRDIHVTESLASFVYRDAEDWWLRRPNIFQTSREMLAPEILARFKAETLEVLSDFQRDEGINDERTALIATARKLAS